MMKNKYITGIMIFLLLLVIPLCKRSAQREKEPNNNFATANRIEPDMAAEGFLGTSEDHDFYRMDIVSPVIIDMELTAVRGINHAIRIWRENNSGQEIVKYIDDSRKSSGERMCNFLFDAGVYYIEITHGERDVPQGSDESRYELILSSREWDGEEEREPNDGPGSANPLEIGKEIKGYFSPSFNKLNQNKAFTFREEDWYYFSIDVTENPVLIDVDLTGVQGVNSVLYIMDSDNNEISSSDIGNTGEGEHLQGIGIKKSGKYYIMAASNFESGKIVPYRLEVTTRSYDNSSEIEPNNSFETPNPVVREEVSGRLFPGGDRDYFLLDKDIFAENTGNDTGRQFLYRIEASSDTVDIVLNLFDAGRRAVFEADNVRGPGREVIPALMLKDNFFIEVYSKRNNIRAGEKEGSRGFDYKMIVSLLPFSDIYEIEPNSTKESATRIKTRKITGYASQKNDRDYYSLEYGKRTRKKIVFYGIKDSEFKISITDNLGFIIKSESVRGSVQVALTEIIDSKAYLIVESVIENYDEAYIIEIGE